MYSSMMRTDRGSGHLVGGGVCLTGGGVCLPGGGLLNWRCVCLPGGGVCLPGKGVRLTVVVSVQTPPWVDTPSIPPPYHPPPWTE